MSVVPIYSASINSTDRSPWEFRLNSCNQTPFTIHLAAGPRPPHSLLSPHSRPSAAICPFAARWSRPRAAVWLRARDRSGTCTSSWLRCCGPRTRLGATTTRVDIARLLLPLSPGVKTKIRSVSRSSTIKNFLFGTTNINYNRSIVRNIVLIWRTLNAVAFSNKGNWSRSGCVTLSLVVYVRWPGTAMDGGRG